MLVKVPNLMSWGIIVLGPFVGDGSLGLAVRWGGGKHAMHGRKRCTMSLFARVCTDISSDQSDENEDVANFHQQPVPQNFKQNLQVR